MHTVKDLTKTNTSSPEPARRKCEQVRVFGGITGIRIMNCARTPMLLQGDTQVTILWPDVQVDVPREHLT